MAEKNPGHLLGKVIAVDFDGCLCEPGLWPEIGRANGPVIEELIRLRNEGVKLILNTCRGGDLLDSAVRWCEAFGLRFDAANENLQERIDAFGGDSRKISADEYWDDRAVPVRFTEAEGKSGSETMPKPEGAASASCTMIEQDNGWHESRAWACSACGDERVMDGTPDEYEIKHCVNCGAKVIGQKALPLLGNA